MKSKYCFIRDLQNFGKDSVVYVVKVGTSDRECMKLESVRQYATDCSIYFRRWDYNVDVALDNLANSVFYGKPFARLFIRKAEITISRLYSMIVDDSFAKFEAKLTASRSLIHVLSSCSQSFYFKNHPLNCNTSCQRLRRKNLSARSGDDFLGACIAFCFILGCYLTSMILEAIEKYLLY